MSGTTYRKAIEITPSNTTNISMVTNGIYIGENGDLIVSFHATPTEWVTFSNVVAGTILPLVVARVNTDTTANNIIGLR